MLVRVMMSVPCTPEAKQLIEATNRAAAWRAVLAELAEVRGRLRAGAGVRLTKVTSLAVDRIGTMTGLDALGVVELLAGGKEPPRRKAA